MFIQRVFGHLIITDQVDLLHKIRTDPSINGVILRRKPSPHLQAYKNTLTKKDLHLRASRSANPYYFRVKGSYHFEKDKTTLTDVEGKLREGFPQGRHFKYFVQDIWNTINNFCIATDSNKAVGRFFVSQAHGIGCWHPDEKTDVRGFKAHCGWGACLRSNAVQKTEFKPSDYKKPTAGELLSDSAIQMQEGDFGIWKGDRHAHPLIHVKPAILPGEFRLSLIISPV